MDERQHPFQPSEKQLLETLGNRMRLFAYLLIGSVVLTLLASVYNLFEMGMSIQTIGLSVFGIGISGIISIVIAFLTLNASAAFDAAARMEGQDVMPLMRALQAFKRLYAIKYWIIVAFILLFLLFLFGMVAILFVA